MYARVHYLYGFVAGRIAKLRRIGRFAEPLGCRADYSVFTQTMIFRKSEEPELLSGLLQVLDGETRRKH